MRKKTVRWTVFADGATSVSEAIGTAVPRQIPITRSKIKSVLVRGRILFCIIHSSIFIIHYSFGKNGFLINDEVANADE